MYILDGHGTLVSNPKETVRNDNTYKI